MINNQNSKYWSESFTNIVGESIIDGCAFCRRLIQNMAREICDVLHLVHSAEVEGFALTHAEFVAAAITWLGDFRGDLADLCYDQKLIIIKKCLHVLRKRF